MSSQLSAETLVANADTASVSGASEARPDDVLVANAVSKRFGGLLALHDIDLRIHRGMIYSLIGPNGAGKTTFFNVVAGIFPPTSGEVLIGGNRLMAPAKRAWLEPILWFLPFFIILALGLPLAGSDVRIQAVWALLALLVVTLILPAAMARPPWYERFVRSLGIFRNARPNDVVRAGIGRTFQNIRLFQNMTAIENVLVGMHLKLHSNPIDALLATPRMHREEAAAAEKARGYLELVGLPGVEDQLARNLPYGGQRRLELARALASEPKLLLLDEPTAGMNPNETTEMMALISRLRTDLGVTILLIEHDMRVVMRISDWITVLDHGETIAEGTPAQVRANPRVIEAYLGKPPE